jgi:hypothetical protein
MSRGWLVFALLGILVGCGREQSAPNEEEKKASEKQVILILHALLDIDMKVMQMSPCPLRTDHYNFETGNLRETFILPNETGKLTFLKNGKEQEIPERVRDARYHSWMFDYRPDKDRLFPVTFKCDEKLSFGTKFSDIRLLGELEKKAVATIQLTDGGQMEAEANARYKVYEAKAILPAPPKTQ